MPQPTHPLQFLKPAARAVLLIAFAPAAFASAALAEDLSASEILTRYKSFPRLTAEPRQVSPRLAALCRVPSQSEVDAETARHGPHTLARVHVYANDIAKPELSKKERRFPVGAIVVKEKLGDGLTPTGIGALQKMPPGYDPEGGDWKYIYSDIPGDLHEGRLAQCRTCHMRAKSRDHVFFPGT